MGLDAKTMSWVLITSLAYSGDETIRVGTWPMFRCINGPCLVAKSLSFWWISEPKSWCTFPKMGSFHGPGGSLDDEFVVFVSIFISINRKISKEKRIGMEGCWSSITCYNEYNLSFESSKYI